MIDDNPRSCDKEKIYGRSRRSPTRIRRIDGPDTVPSQDRCVAARPHGSEHEWSADTDRDGRAGSLGGAERRSLDYPGEGTPSPRPEAGMSASWAEITRQVIERAGSRCE